MSCSVLTKQGLECSRDGYYAGCCLTHADGKIKKNTEGVKLVDIIKATDGKHKWVAIFDKNGSEKRVPFGAKGMDDVTLTKDYDQRDRYWQRHQKDLRTLDPTKPGYLSLFILWDTDDMKTNIRRYKKNFGL